METIELEAKKRDEAGKGLKQLRSQGLVPAVIYGRKIKNLSVFVDKKSFQKKILNSGAGMNAIIALKVEGEKELPVLAHIIQRDFISDDILHIDFRHIIMDEMIKTKVHLELTGIPLGVKDDGGVLIHGLREVEVECLPTDIPDKFEIDVTALKIGDSLHVSDLTNVSKVKILTNLSEMIANCPPPTKEEEVVAAIPTPEEAAAAAAGEPAATEEAGKEKAAGAAAPAKGAPAAEPAKAGSEKKK